MAGDQSSERAEAAIFVTRMKSEGTGFELTCLCLVALALRIGLYAIYPGFVHPDETFQYIEPAHRIVYGVGAIPWEYQVGIRNWVLPGLLAGIIEISRLFGEEPGAEHWTIAVAMSLISLVPVVCAWLWGKRLVGMPGAILAGGIVAVWFETVFYGPHPLADTFAAAFLAAGLWLGDPATPALSGRRIFWTGVVLSITVVVRIQLGPALAIPALALCRLQLRTRWVPLLAGAAIPLLLLGLLDRLTWGSWFQSVLMYVWINEGLGLANIFGIQPWYSYPGWMLLNWVWAFPLLLVTAVVGGRLLPVPAVCFVVTVLFFSLIPHKEERFIYPVMPLLLTLVGIGTARLMRGLRPRVPAAFLALFVWGLVSITLGRRELFEGTLQYGTGMVRIMSDIANDTSACGVAILPIDDDWSKGGWVTGGYTSLRHGVSLYQAKPATAPMQPDAFNAILSRPDATLADTRYSRIICRVNGPPEFPWHDVCVWRRQGACDATSAAPIVAPHEAVMDRIR